jgi:hypothetical protein
MAEQQPYAHHALGEALLFGNDANSGGLEEAVQSYALAPASCDRRTVCRLVWPAAALLNWLGASTLMQLLEGVGDRPTPRCVSCWVGQDILRDAAASEGRRALAQYHQCRAPQRTYLYHLWQDILVRGPLLCALMGWWWACLSPVGLLPPVCCRQIGAFPKDV